MDHQPSLQSLAIVAVLAALRLVSIEWVALGLSIVAIVLAGYSTVRAMQAVRQISEVTDQQSQSVADLTVEAEAVHEDLAPPEELTLPEKRSDD